MTRTWRLFRLMVVLMTLVVVFAIAAGVAAADIMAASLRNKIINCFRLFLEKIDFMTTSVSDSFRFIVYCRGHSRLPRLRAVPFYIAQGN